jgi:Fur family ferric uptake transcriptional regulator
MQWHQILQEKGLKVTSARVTILRCLAAAGRAVSHPDLCRQLEEAGSVCDKTTVYRTLEALIESGIVHKVPTPDRVWMFSLTDEHTGKQHHGAHHVHFRCDGCTQTFCMEAAQLSVDIALTPQDSAAFAITSQEILLHGYCPQCNLL